MAGIISNDRAQGARVRRLLLNEVERLFTADPLSLSETEHSTKRELLLRMSPNTLPRLHEHTGEDGDPIKYTMVNYADPNAPIPTSAISSAVNPSV